MNPHKHTLKVFLLLIFVFLFAEVSFPKDVSVGRRGIVVEERHAALRSTPQLNGPIVRRLSRGRIVYIRGLRTTSDGVVFFSR
jgi:hypothetical protein